MTPPTQLLLNPSFSNDARGWVKAHAKTTRLGNQHCVELAGDIHGDEPWSSLLTTVIDIPINQKLHFSCNFRRAISADNVIITAYAFDEFESVLQTWKTSWFAIVDKWTIFEALYVVPDKTKGLWIWIQNYSKTSAYVRRASLTTGTAYKADQISDSQTASILEVNFHIAVQAVPGKNRGSVTFPIPGLYREQIPLTFEVSSNPKSALTRYKIFPREDGVNWLCQVDLQALHPVTINWKALVLVAGRKRTPLKKSATEVPQKLTQWLRSTACVQSSDAAIEKKAKQIVIAGEDVESSARKIMKFAAANQGFEGELFSALDAKSALACGGSCTSRANLAAALLRASGIAARTISHIPIGYSWMDAHWITEYWHPDCGWIWLETTKNVFEPQPNRLVVLAVSSADDEDKSLDLLQLRTVMPGAPYLSIGVVSEELTLGYGCRQNFACELGKLKGTKQQLNQLQIEATRAFSRITKSNFTSSNSAKQKSEIIAAAQNGSAIKLITALRNNIP